MSAFGGTTDLAREIRYVGFVPEADILDKPETDILDKIEEDCFCQND